MTKWVEVKTSRPHRQKKHAVKSYSMGFSDAHRNKTYKRRPRRTKAEIARLGKRKPLKRR